MVVVCCLIGFRQHLDCVELDNGGVGERPIQLVTWLWSVVLGDQEEDEVEVVGWWFYGARAENKRGSARMFQLCVGWRRVSVMCMWREGDG